MVCESWDAWSLRYVGILVCGSCVAWELQCILVAVHEIGVVVCGGSRLAIFGSFCVYEFQFVSGSVGEWQNSLHQGSLSFAISKPNLQC